MGTSLRSLHSTPFYVFLGLFQAFVLFQITFLIFAGLLLSFHIHLNGLLPRAWSAPRQLQMGHSATLNLTPLSKVISLCIYMIIPASTQQGGTKVFSLCFHIPRT